MDQQPKEEQSQPEISAQDLFVEQFMKKPLPFITPPMDNVSNIDIYPQRLEKEVLPHLKFCQNFFHVVQLQHPPTKPNEQVITAELKNELKMIAYQIFSQMIRSFKAFSGQLKEKSNWQPPRIEEKVQKFIQICEQIRKFEQRRVVCGYLEEETIQMRKETQQIHETIDQMVKEAKQYAVEDESLNSQNVEENPSLGIQVQHFYAQSSDN